MDFIKWFVGGLIGAAIGGAVWIAVGYFLEAEVGYIAWGIGLLAGIGVRAMAGNSQGAMCGIAGVLSAVGVVLLSKYLVISLHVNALIAKEADLGSRPTPNAMISSVAHEVVMEYEDAGKSVAWPAGMDPEEAYEQQHFPKDVWAEAKQRWDDLSPDEQQQQIDERVALVQMFVDQMSDTVKEEAFKESLSPFDLLWLGLAAFTAFRVGAGGTEE